MPANLTPASAGDGAVERYDPRADLQSYAPAHDAGGEPPASGPQFARYLAALNRYKWLIPIFLILGTAGGLTATRFIEPQYEVNANILITSETQPGRNNNDGSYTQAQGWQDLLKTYAIADTVVTKLALYVLPDDEKDAPVFAGFQFRGTSFKPGDYTLEVENGRYRLHDKLGLTDEKGAVGDSIGRAAGFAWAPTAAILGTKSREIDFVVMQPREASYDVVNRMNIRLLPGSPVLSLSLRGTKAQRPEATLNAYLEQFVALATVLKKAQLVQRANTYNAQLEETKANLQQTEGELESYRIGTIALPSEGSPIAMGLDMTRDPTFTNYFNKKYEYDALSRDIAEIERVSAPVIAGTADANTVNRLLSIPTLAGDAGAKPLQMSIEQLNETEARLRVLRQTLRDEAEPVKNTLQTLTNLQRQTLPQQINAYVASLRSRQSTLGQTIASATSELRAIPSRTIREGQLKRDQAIAASQYETLQQQAAEANMAVASAVPDVRVLDQAVEPLRPTNKTTSSILLAAVLGSLAAAIGLALLLDRVDRRFRYPDQATQELGLHILGVVPVIDQSGRQQSPERVAQIVESFRSIRMNVRYASLPQSGGIALTVTSPGPDDGKSLISSNLALSFAEGGWRTVLVDGDTRRGQLHATFGVTQKPGLLEYLGGSSLLGEVLYATTHENLTLLPCGMRLRRGPELLSTPRMSQLIASLAADYDVVIVDSPPLGAGTDAYALGMACEQIAVVLRCGKTDRRMASAKIDALRQLPINVVGAILNGVEATGIYQYYSYDPEYALVEDDTDTPRLAATTGGDDDEYDGEEDGPESRGRIS